VPKDEFIEVSLELVLAHSVVGFDKPLLEISDRPVGKGNSGFGSFSQFRAKRLDANDVPVACLD
jgi:hypothetical protein